MAGLLACLGLIRELPQVLLAHVLRETQAAALIKSVIGV